MVVTIDRRLNGWTPGREAARMNIADNLARSAAAHPDRLPKGPTGKILKREITVEPCG